MLINYISFDSISEGVGASQVLKLVETYMELGQEVNLVTFEKMKPNKDLLKKFYSTGIRWKPIPFGNLGLIGGITRVKTLMREIPHGNVIHARGDLPAFCGLVGTSQPLLWDVRSLWVEQRKMMNPREFTKPVEITLKQMNRYVARNCAAFTTLTDAIVPSLISSSPELPSIHKTIPTCVDLNMFKVSEFDKNPITQILLLGNYNKLYNTFWMREFLLEWRKIENTNILWAHDAEFVDKSHPLSVFEQVTVPHSDVPQLIKQSHIGLLFLNQSKNMSLKAAMPTKIAEFWASGRPIIISKGVGDIDQIIEKYRVGVSVDQSIHPKDSIERIRSIISDSQTPDRCRYVAEKFFNMQLAAQDYLNLLTQIAI